MRKIFIMGNWPNIVTVCSLHLTKTFVVETLYYCNLLCYLKCSTSLLTWLRNLNTGSRHKGMWASLTKITRRHTCSARSHIPYPTHHTWSTLWHTYVVTDSDNSPTQIMLWYHPSLPAPLGSRFASTGVTTPGQGRSCKQAHNSF